MSVFEHYWVREAVSCKEKNAWNLTFAVKGRYRGKQKQFRYITKNYAITLGIIFVLLFESIPIKRSADVKHCDGYYLHEENKFMNCKQETSTSFFTTSYKKCIKMVKIALCSDQLGYQMDGNWILQRDSFVINVNKLY
jgi:hypothetical protein